MFQPPNRTVDPEGLILANELLQASNSTLANLEKFRAEQFQRFWFRSKNQPRTPQEINAILEQMDAAQPGQSAQFFAAAKALVDLIDVLSPGKLQPEDWWPRYEYTIDPATFALRVNLPPEPVDDPVVEGAE
jgi:hypothetical protein